jgi:hypothetical protein
MSKWGPDEAPGTDGDSPDEVLPRANVPARPVWKVGYPAGKLVVNPGKLAMVNAKLLQEQETSAMLVGWAGENTCLCTCSSQLTEL